MSYEQSITLLDEETVLAECGPMRLAIRAWQNGRPQIALCRQAAEASFAYLEAVAKHKAMLSDFGPIMKASSELRSHQVTTA